ncbi:MAG: response regulator transcription factor [Bacteroidetes bacterium]|nr:response regulator transcription factor [Bacteroidota bacterium]
MNCIIVDDDATARLDLENKIAQVSFLNLAQSCSSPAEAITALMGEQVDLMILDVMMPETNGLELMNALKEERPQVILISSNKDFAVDAFDFEVTDFIVKPISNERFFRSITKAKRMHEMQTGISSHDEEHLFIKVNSRLVKIDTRDILFVEALADYVTIHRSVNKYTIHSTMKGMEKALSEKKFFRAHNSYIIRLDKISEIEDNCLVLGPKLIPVSRSKLKGLMQRLKFLA